MDKTYINAKSQWGYLDWALDKEGNAVITSICVLEYFAAELL
ncbi:MULTISPECIES: transposase [Legionella]|nr:MULTISPECIES: transposase [Legionella]